MDVTMQEYPALLASLQPNQAATVLNDRLKVINKVNSDIADWLQERRKVEDAYVRGLRGLAQRRLQDHGASLGVFQVPWKRIVSSTESMAQAHETLSHNIDVDVERPLREYATKNPNISQMPQIHGDLATRAKNLENAQKKADKFKDKGPKSSDKATSAISGASDLKQQWDSSAPFVFEKLQAADESRVNHLRDLLTQLETHELDTLESNRKTVENCLNTILAIETIDEIKHFATKIGGGSSTSGPSAATRTSSARHTQSTSGDGASLQAPPKIHTDDAVSQLSGRSAHAQPASSMSEPRQTPFGGLKRLGTVMGRRKSIAQGGPSQEKKRRPFGTKRGGSSQDSQQPRSPSPPQTGQTGSLSVESHDESIRPASASRGASNDAMEPISEGQQTPKAVVNGTGITGNTLQEEPQKMEERETDAEGFSTRPDTIDEITRLQKEASAAEEPSPNLTIRDQPIHEDENAAQQAMNDVASRLRLQGQQSGIRRNAGTLRGRRDVRNTVFVPNASSPEQEIPSHSPGAAVGAIPQQPAKSVKPPSTNASEDRAISDTTSVHSSHTLHSLAGPVLHPDLHESGLNASIVETVSSWMTDGEVTKSFVVGELALAYNPLGDPHPEKECIRLDNFQVLEKVAANPHFVTEASPTPSVKGKERETSEDEKRGQYNVSLPMITRPTPTVAFKYQVHINQQNLSSYSPVIFTPTWNLEEFQASVIIKYAINPSFTSLESVNVKDLILTVNLDLSPDETAEQPREIPRATQAVMYPNAGATFRRKQSAVVWKMPNLEVKAGEDGKFLARFSTQVSWPRKGKAEAKFEVKASTTQPQLGVSVAAAPSTEQKEIDPFADDIPAVPGDGSKPNPNAWKDVPLSRKLVAGKYVCS